MVKLLKEYYEIKAPTEEMLNEYREAEKEGKPIIIKGLIQRADAKNQNGRIYPFEILKKEVQRYIEEAIKSGTAMGELDHVDNPVLNLERASHILRDVWWEGKDLHGAVELMDTPNGQIAKTIHLKHKVPLGISSRAVGSVSKNESQGADIVDEDLQIICWDLVGQPSTQGAYLKLYEAKEIGEWDRSKGYPKQARIKQILDEILKR